MWGTKYDENLQNNLFFKEIITNHSDLVTKASQSDWIICVPKSGSYTIEEITKEKILDHILIPTEAPPNQVFTTLSEKTVTIKHQEIIEKQPSRILFEETFYIQDLKYTVFCLACPLFTNRITCDNHQLITLETLHDCIDFLWGENLEHLLVKIQKLCNNFIEENRGFQLENIQTQRELIGCLYSQCLQLVLKDNKLNSDCCYNLKLAVETYMQSCLDKILIRAINTAICFSDANFNKIARKLYNSLEPEDTKICDILLNSEWELNKINNYNTILDKVNCLKLTFDNLYKGNLCTTTDDILQSFIILIVKSNVTNWYSNLAYLTQFQFSSSDSANETNFVITSLEAALEYIKNDEWQSKNHRSQGAIFDTIAQGDLTQIQTLLDYNKESNKNLCHPLCDCEKCVFAASPILGTINDKGQNLLTYATIKGRRNMVEFLLGKRIDSSRDYFGKLPIHYACQHGYQDILLILLELNRAADVNVKDYEGNTPFHLACKNGHESCVKALSYTAKNLHLNSSNKNNETPLLTAIKYNYIGIVQLLLGNGALATIGDKKKKFPLDFAQNYYTERLLRQYHNFGSPTIFDWNSHGRKPKGAKQNKKIDLLLKAIENDDLPMAYFYLGFPSNNSKREYDFTSKCHPLCNCDKCGQGDEKPSVAFREKLSVNTCNVDGFTPLHFAAKHGRCDLLRLLLDAQASPSVKTYKTLHTPLHLACIHRRINIVKELVKCGDCDLDALDYKGNTPLHYACVNGDAKIIEVLLSNGANDEKGNLLSKDIMMSDR